MNFRQLRDAVELSRQLGHVIIATTGASGIPHLAAAGSLEPLAEDGIAMTSWYCPQTMLNLQDNPQVAVVVWDAAKDTGYQLLGELEEVSDRSVMDGYAPAIEGRMPLLDVEKQLLVRVRRILTFHRAAHSDTEEE